MPDETMIGFLEMLTLVHGLVGLCVGWIWGSQFGVLAGIATGIEGATVGLAAGFLVSRMPRCVSAAARRISGNPVLSTVLAASGHLVWLAAGLCFWWISFRFFAGELNTP